MSTVAAAAPPSLPAAAPALAVSGLSVVYHAGDQRVRALDDVELSVPDGCRIAIVGESGSGKSTLGLALMGLLPANSRFEYRQMAIGGEAVDLHDRRALRGVRGKRLSMVFQDAKASLDPVRTIGSQVAEPLRVHRVVGRKEVPAAVAQLLGAVEIHRPDHVAGQYPHELSGGMRQRAMIAAALAGRPSVLIADEPTSALDVTTQSAVIDLIRRIGDERRMATLLITHDLALVAGFADVVVVMYAGQIVEQGRVDDVYAVPAHPYTRALLGSIPSLFDDRAAELGSIPGALPDLARPATGCRFEPRCAIGNGREVCRTRAPAMVPTAHGQLARCHFPDELAGTADGESAVTLGSRRSGSGALVAELAGIHKVFVGRGRGSAKQRVTAVDRVDLSVRRGESIGIVGESGSGKTTLARIFVGLERADAGSISIVADGVLAPVTKLPKDYVQFVFQDPGDSLDPLMSVGQIVAEPLVLRDGGNHKRYRAQAQALLEDVGLRADMVDRRPLELSGGQRQRVAIARALSTQPQVIIADEAVASLDMSARGQILNLFSRLQDEHGFAYVYISHDLSMVRHVCDRVVVMYGGQVVETASTDELFVAPRHPYTQALISAVPIPDPALERRRTRRTIEGEAGGGIAPTGCGFRLRCPLATERCTAERPRLDPAAEHGVACHYPELAADTFARAAGG